MTSTNTLKEIHGSHSSLEKVSLGVAKFHNTRFCQFTHWVSGAATAQTFKSSLLRKPAARLRPRASGSNGSNGHDGKDGANGLNGKDAKYFMGAVGPAIVGKPCSACHHDYLYFPDPDNTSRGWLTFRHQSNGQADQGVGSTGFQVWNVDIGDFLLASEVGGLTYCTLHWDPSAHTLSYQVVDATDGLAGTTGSLRFDP